MLINDNSYFQALEDVKARILSAQHRAVLGVNREQIELFWNIGKVIIENTKYGNKFVENLARDIKMDFPNAKGYSVRNLKYMRKFAAFVPDVEIVQTVSALFPRPVQMRQTYAYNGDFVPNNLSLSESLI